MSLLDKLCTMWPSAPEVDEEMPPEEGDTEPGAGEEAPTEMQMRLAEKAVVDLGKIYKRAAIHKLGAKMSKDRFSRLQQALGVLTNLVGELAPQAGDPGGGDAPPAPALGKAVPPGKDDKKKPPTMTKSDEALEAIGKAITKLSDGLTQVATTVKTLTGDVSKIQKSRAPGNAIGAEGGAGAPEAKPHSWPMDMTRPITRDTVAKTESYFDDEND